MENEPENEKQEPGILLPVIHDQCPVCGSSKRLGELKVNELKASGALPQTFPYQGMTLQAPLVDQQHPPKIIGPVITIKVMLMSIDVCAEPTCGAVYCTSFNIVDTPAQVQAQQQPMHNPSFRNFPGQVGRRN
jgi:hypothetical protein